MLQRTTQPVISGPYPFDADAHNIYVLNSGSDFMEHIIIGRAGRDFGPGYAEYVFTVPGHGNLSNVVGYTSGSIIRHDHAGHELPAPRIHLEVTAVNQNYQGMNLGSALIAELIQTLYARANCPVIEVRSIDAIGARVAPRRRELGFQPIIGTSDLSMMLTPETIIGLKAWQPRPRPGMRFSGKFAPLTP